VPFLLTACRPAPATGAFVGHWWGHVRALEITADGRGQEGIDAGGLRVVALHFRVLHVGGTRARAVATVRVTYVRLHKWARAELQRQPPYVGQIGTLVLREGVITDDLTGKTFCAETVDKCGL
jgi:hypothetical protein